MPESRPSQMPDRIRRHPGALCTRGVRVQLSDRGEQMTTQTPAVSFQLKACFCKVQGVFGVLSKRLVSYEVRSFISDYSQ